MPMFAKFYKMAPSEFWRLTLREYNALTEFIDEYAREMEKINRG